MKKKTTRNKLVTVLKRYGTNKPISITLESFRGVTIGGKSNRTKILMYIKLLNHKVYRTEEIKQNELYIDYDRRGEIVGIEII